MAYRQIRQLLSRSLILGVACFATATTASNISCRVQVARNPAWETYEVVVTMYDLGNHHPIASLLFPAEKSGTTATDKLIQAFACDAHQEVGFSATFSPAVWQNERDMVYPSTVIADISAQLHQIPKGADNLTISVNFPDDFLNVPEPNK